MIRSGTRRRRVPIAIGAAVLVVTLAIALGYACWWRADPYQTVDLATLGSFPLDPARDTEADIPADRLALDGKKVRLRGEMFAPGHVAKNVTEFQLVAPDSMTSRMPPRVQERVFARVPGNVIAPNLSGSPAEVRGRLRIKLERAHGEAVSLFTIEVDGVTPPVTAPPPDEIQWALALLFLGVPGLAIIAFAYRRSARRARLPGRCKHCGYDLRGTPDACPECGRAVLPPYNPACRS